MDADALIFTFDSEDSSEVQSSAKSGAFTGLRAGTASGKGAVPLAPFSAASSGRTLSCRLAAALLVHGIAAHSDAMGVMHRCRFKPICTEV